MYFALYMYSMPVDLRFRRLRAQKVAVLVPTLRSISRETDFVGFVDSHDVTRHFLCMLAWLENCLSLARCFFKVSSSTSSLSSADILRKNNLSWCKGGS